MKMGKTMSKKVESSKADRQEDQRLAKIMVKPGKPGAKSQMRIPSKKG